MKEAGHDRVVIQKPDGKPRFIPLPALAQTDRWGTLAVVAAAVESVKRGQLVDISTKPVRAQLAI
jgi:hypothetical protein